MFQRGLEGVHSFRCYRREKSEELTLFLHVSGPGCYGGEINSKKTKGNTRMAKPNYQFEKRSRELAKKKKKEEKRLRKQAEKDARSTADAPVSSSQ